MSIKMSNLVETKTHMKKHVLTILSFFALNISLFSQDLITKKTGEDIKAIVVEVNQTDIKYKRFDNQNGPTFSLLKLDVLMIRYANGTKDIFSQTEAEQPTATDSKVTLSKENMARKGRVDAQRYYKGQNSGANWTAATTILTSPIIGVVPAVIACVIEPSDNNLNYPDDELMKNDEYREAYISQARKTKARKNLISYGVSTGVWVVLISVLAY